MNDKWPVTWSVHPIQSLTLFLDTGWPRRGKSPRHLHVVTNGTSPVKFNFKVVWNLTTWSETRRSRLRQKDKVGVNIGITDRVSSVSYLWYRTNLFYKKIKWGKCQEHDLPSLSFTIKPSFFVFTEFKCWFPVFFRTVTTIWSCQESWFLQISPLSKLLSWSRLENLFQFALSVVTNLTVSHFTLHYVLLFFYVSKVLRVISYKRDPT